MNELKSQAVSNLKWWLETMNDSPKWVYFQHLKQDVQDNIDMLEHLGEANQENFRLSWGDRNHGEYVTN